MNLFGNIGKVMGGGATANPFFGIYQFTLRFFIRNMISATGVVLVWLVDIFRYHTVFKVR
jgi:hypothetical protein